MVSILVLSDLHFGVERSHQRPDSAIAQRHIALDGLVKVIQGLETSWLPNVVVIPGDVSWSSSSAEYKEAEEWIRGALHRLNISTDSLVMCPGNHDINRTEALGMARPSAATEADQWLDPSNLANFTRPFAAYCQFRDNLGIPELAIGSRTSHLAGTRDISGIRFVSLNSAWFSRDNEDEGKLWLGLPQLQVLEGAGALASPTGLADAPITVSVFHHPPEWLNVSDKTEHNDRPSAFPHLARRCHIIITGHTHSRLRPADRIQRRAFRFSSGATYLDGYYRNAVLVLRIQKETRTADVMGFEYNPSLSQWRDFPFPDCSKYKLVGANTGPPLHTPRALAPRSALSLSLDRASIKILHLSSLLTENSDAPVSLIGRLARQLSTPKGDDCPIDLVVVSGDSTSSGAKAQMKIALKCYSQLSEFLDLNRDRFIMVPGNHDLDWGGLGHAWIPTHRSCRLNSAESFTREADGFVVLPSNAHRNMLKPFSEYLHRGFFKEPYPLDPREQVHVNTISEIGLQILSFNTTAQLSPFFPKRVSVESGALLRGIILARKQAARYSEANSHTKRPLSRIFVSHHSIESIASLVNTSVGRELHKAGFTLGLCGRSSPETPGLPVISESCPSTTIRGGALVPHSEPGASCQVLELFPRECVRVWTLTLVDWQRGWVVSDRCKIPLSKRAEGN